MQLTAPLGYLLWKVKMFWIPFFSLLRLKQMFQTPFIDLLILSKNNMGKNVTLPLERALSHVHPSDISPPAFQEGLRRSCRPCWTISLSYLQISASLLKYLFLMAPGCYAFKRKWLWDLPESLAVSDAKELWVTASSFLPQQCLCFPLLPVFHIFQPLLSNAFSRQQCLHFCH